ncbi:MAG: ATP-dependent DNA helicase [Polyangiaceae bacterium]|nr:ATP-dependent DNA helicase [Polyangiaceae bacterium]
MALAVERALRVEHVLLCEAGTGTGKTFAYLVPALLSGKKVIVSTATRALQDQIYQRDLPALVRALGVDAPVALMKGLGNYVCRRRLGEAVHHASSLDPARAQALGVVQRFTETSESGDVSELSALPEDHPVWADVSSSSETRVGAECGHFDECFVTKMKRDAERARLVVVNHHLFFADLAVRGDGHPGKVLPDHDAVIFDEAHQLEDVATHFFGVRVSRARVEQVLRDARRALERAGLGELLLAAFEGQGRSLPLLERATDRFFAAVSGRARRDEGRVAVEAEAWTDLRAYHEELDDALRAFGAFARDVAGRFDAGEGPVRGKRAAAVAEALAVAGRRAESMAADLTLIGRTGGGRVSWVEVGARNVAVGASPVDVSGILRDGVFDSTPAVVLTSATLGTTAAPAALADAAPAPEPAGAGADGPGERSTFAFLRGRLGLEGACAAIEELALPSPFDFAASALLYVPSDLPDPRDPGFIAAAAARIHELVRCSGGGAFVLTTSRRSMRALHERLAGLLATPPLLQGTAPKATLVARFREAGDAVLVATSSFWEGVDVPGRALRLVVLEKIPFAVPTDPVFAARSREIEARGESPFSRLAVPQAAIALRQGFGRLIRGERDRGVVALLDGRALAKGYGRRLLAALPPAPRTDRLAVVQEFFGARAERE